MSDQAETRSPFQFRVIDAVAIMTVAALVAAMTAPHFRELTATQLKRAGWVLLVEMVVAGAGFVSVVHARHELLAKGGRRLVRGFRSSERSRYAPEVKSLAIIVVLGAFQILLGIALVRETKGNEWVVAVGYYAQLSFVTGRCMANFLTRTYPFTVDIFENGIGWGSSTFLPWDEISLRRSSFGSNRLIFVVRMEDVPYTLTVFMDPKSCDNVMRLWEARRRGNAHSVSRIAPEIE